MTLCSTRSETTAHHPAPPTHYTLCKVMKAQQNAEKERRRTQSAPSVLGGQHPQANQMSRSMYGAPVAQAPMQQPMYEQPMSPMTAPATYQQHGFQEPATAL